MPPSARTRARPEDNRRASNGEQVNRVATLAMTAKPSVDTSSGTSCWRALNYWMRPFCGVDVPFDGLPPPVRFKQLLRPRLQIFTHSP
jgi:hypothetical protein